jgi:putative flippase GtrA
VSDHRLLLRAALSQACIARCAAVAAGCTLLQLLILAGLAALGAGKVVADGLGFALAAQVNFVLRTIWTWRDRLARQAGWASQAARWAMFNATALVNHAVLFGGSVAAVSYTVTSDCVQFRPAS